MKRKKSLHERVVAAEQEAEAVKRRLEARDREVRRCNALCDGAMIWVAALAYKIGPEVHITKEEFDRIRAQGIDYSGVRHPDGSMTMYLNKKNKKS